MLYTEIIAVCSEIHTKHTNSQYGWMWNSIIFYNAVNKITHFLQRIVQLLLYEYSFSVEACWVYTENTFFQWAWID